MPETQGDVIVLDIGGTNVRMGYARAGVPATDFHLFSSQTLNVVGAYSVLAKEIKAYAAARNLEPSAVALGIPGMLDEARDTISHSNNIPHLEGSGLRTTLEAALDCRVILEQDIMLQLLGEWYAGAAKGSDAVFGVYFGTGIGAAYLQNGDPFRRGAAGLQVGHIPVMAEGKPCICGNSDCVETYACGHTLTELAAETGIAVEELFVRRQHEGLAAALDRFILLEAYVIATVITLTEPDTVLIGGGIPTMADYPRDDFTRKVRNHLQKPYPADTVKLRWATLGKQASLYGALALLNMTSSHERNTYALNNRFRPS